MVAADTPPPPLDSAVSAVRTVHPALRCNLTGVSRPDNLPDAIFQADHLLMQGAGAICVRCCGEPPPHLMGWLALHNPLHHHTLASSRSQTSSIISLTRSRSSVGLFTASQLDSTLECLTTDQVVTGSSPVVIDTFAPGGVEPSSPRAASFLLARQQHFGEQAWHDAWNERDIQIEGTGDPRHSPPWAGPGAVLARRVLMSREPQW